MDTEYVGISHAEKVYAQEGFLQSEIGVLNCLKKLKALKKLRKEEFALKVELKGKVGEVFEKLDKLEGALPKTQYKYRQRAREVEEGEEDLGIEGEIDRIQRKLARLGS